LRRQGRLVFIDMCDMIEDAGSHGFLHFSVTVPCSGGQGADAHSKHTKHTQDSKDSKDLVMRAQVPAVSAS